MTEYSFRSYGNLSRSQATNSLAVAPLARATIDNFRSILDGYIFRQSYERVEQLATGGQYNLRICRQSDMTDLRESRYWFPMYILLAIVELHLIPGRVEFGGISFASHTNESTYTRSFY